MYKYLLLLLLSPLAVADDSCPYQQGVAIIGVATNVSDSTFLYCEYHFFTDQDGSAIGSVISMERYDHFWCMRKNSSSVSC
jgi:hypothetical protein